MQVRAEVHLAGPVGVLTSDVVGRHRGNISIMLPPPRKLYSHGKVVSPFVLSRLSWKLAALPLPPKCTLETLLPEYKAPRFTKPRPNIEAPKIPPMTTIGLDPKQRKTGVKREFVSYDGLRHPCGELNCGNSSEMKTF